MKTRAFALLLPCLLLSPAWTLSSAEAPLDEELLGMVRLVADADGFTNLRTSPTLQAQIAGQVPSGSVVAVEAEPKNGWVKLQRQLMTEKPLYIHGSRLRSVSAWKQVTVKDVAPESRQVTLAHLGMTVSVKAVPFRAEDHRITKDADGMHRVDGGHPWGQDGGLPRLSLSLAVELNGRTVPLPAEALRDLYEPSMESLVLLTPSDPAKQAFIWMTNGDGAGGYCVVWAFENGEYRGRAVFVPF